MTQNMGISAQQHQVYSFDVFDELPKGGQCQHRVIVAGNTVNFHPIESTDLLLGLLVIMALVLRLMEGMTLKCILT